MHVLTLGLNHKTAPLSLREKFAFSGQEQIEALKRLKSYSSIEECLILSTCNRVEFYIASDNVEEASNALKDFILEFKNIDIAVLENSLYFYEDTSSLEHLFKVVTGLDSLVLGETQVFSQVKEAYRLAFEQKCTLKTLNLIFQRAFALNKRARNNFAISEPCVSIGSVAIELAKEKLFCLEEKKALVIGTGEICRLILKCLSKEKLKTIYIANRTFASAKELAGEFNGEAIEFKDLGSCLPSVDMLISSTSAPHYILDKKKAVAAAGSFKKPLTILDLAVPRDIDPDLGRLNNVYLYNIDDLKFICNEKYQKRELSLQSCRDFIKCESEKLFNKLCFDPKEYLINA